MKPNEIRKIWSEGRCVLNGWLSIANGFSAEIMAEQGYDSIGIDLQHGIVDYQAAVSMLQGMRASGVVPLIRVPWLDPAQIMKALDAGAYGIVCPMINTRAEAEALVSYVRYPPTGVRSFGPSRAAISAGSNYGQKADAQVLCLAMIETAEAMKNLDEIVATPGLDGVYIGPADLTIGLTGMKYPTGFDREEPEIIENIKRILNAAHGAGIKAALHCGTPTYAAKAAGWGFDMVTVSNDVRLLAGAAAASVKTFRELTAAGQPDQETSKSSY
ncbi:HpcH/HpaI aldolase family protein [Brucella pseudogrignonensis]|uniref:HpcH/HpaI aldolase family protein n=1 Tax=Brucella pseudogrignonensis TaxID=419475 RepID=UPI003D998FEF